MKKKRKGILDSDSGSLVSNRKSHYSLEDYNRLKKRCKEIASPDYTVSRKTRIAATAPLCGASSSVSSGRGVKRKIGCIGKATQTGRKNKIDEDYVAGKIIGKGKFGSVWVCRNRVTEVDFACKTLVKGEETVHREVEVMQHLSGHPGVVTIEAVYEDSDSIHLVMELCNGGRLIDQMASEGKYSEHRAANIFKELMLVIKYCHDMGVVHRDIKPENILLTSFGKIKLADFGLAMRISNGQSLSGLAGSPAYVAPEVLSENYSEKVDVWSAGVLLHALLVGVLPFQGDSLEAVFEAIKTVNLDFHSGIWKSVSKPARNLLERILTKDASARITADEVLCHPWILLYTERTLKTLSIKSKSKNPAGPSSYLPSTPTKPESNGSPNKKRSPASSSSGSLYHQESEEQDDCDGLIDALAVAVSNITISSKSKRTRLCVRTSPIREQCSSNNLCKAF